MAINQHEFSFFELVEVPAALFTTTPKSAKRTAGILHCADPIPNAGSVSSGIVLSPVAQLKLPPRVLGRVTA
jgi:hypothetical protein